MARECRIITPKDELVVSDYARILHKVIDEISGFYEGTDIIEKARQKYTPEYIQSHLMDPEIRFIGHFDDDTLDGILIEGFRSDSDEKKTGIYWVMADTKNKGIGTELITDCVSRARSEDKDVVILGVAAKNLKAIKLYERLGFIVGRVYNKNSIKMILMGSVIE
jgi:GNAT superfamily N-acetyltransferase